MKKLPQKPLLLAYIIFLCISYLYHIIADIFEWQFSTWENIVVAATVASYAFSISSLQKFFAKKNQTYSQLLNQYLGLKKELRKVESERIKECEDKQELLNSGEDIIHTTVSLISSVENQERIYNKVAFYLDVLGYLSFFCILGFNAVFNWFYPTQDTFTILAFIIIMVIEYIESVQSVKYEEIFNILIKSTQDTINHIKENKSNGEA